MRRFLLLWTPHPLKLFSLYCLGWCNSFYLPSLSLHLSSRNQMISFSLLLYSLSLSLCRIKKPFSCLLITFSFLTFSDVVISSSWPLTATLVPLSYCIFLSKLNPLFYNSLKCQWWVFLQVKRLSLWPSIFQYIKLFYSKGQIVKWRVSPGIHFNKIDK